MEALLHSRKFWLMVFDVVCSTVFYLGSMLWPEYQEQVKALVLMWQPVVIAVIAGITIEDAAEKHAASKVVIEPPAGE